MSIFESIDAGLTGLVGQWNGYSTGLATLVVLMITFSIMTAREPDVHPMLLARQSVPSAVRKEGESAIYRSQGAPHGMPLNTGLNVKDPGTAKWSRGRDGDLRDVWRKAVTGGEDGAKGRVLTVLGSENVVEHKLENITRQINLIGKHIEEQRGSKVAIYLPNSVELLVALFACSFYPTLTAVLIPFDVSNEELISMIRRAGVDTVVTAPGAFPLDDVISAYPALKQLIWVVDQGNSHLDWNEVPEGMGGSVNVATWSDIVNDAPASAGSELPEVDASTTPKDLIAFWQGKPGQVEEMVSFTQGNLVAGIAGQLSAIPTRERFNVSDLFLSTDSLTNVHTLILTLAALYSNASVAFNSVAGSSADLYLATQGIAPTILVASANSLLTAREESLERIGSPLAKISHYMATRALTQEGVFSVSNWLSNFSSGARIHAGNTPGKLRLVFTAERAGTGSSHLSSHVLTDLRIFTRARVVYALTTAKVAGAVAQSAVFDYRQDPTGKRHFGGPITCVEIMLKDSGAHKTTDDKPEGAIYARGPSVIGGETGLGVMGRITDDHTITYA